MDLQPSALFSSLQHVCHYLKYHKHRFRSFFNELPIEIPPGSMDFSSMTDFLNVFTLLKENIAHVIAESTPNPPSYLDLEALRQEQCLLLDITSQIQFRMREDLRSFIKSMKKYCLSEPFEQVSIFKNSILEFDLSSCLSGLKALMSEVRRMLAPDEDLEKKHKKVTEVFVRKTQERLGLYSMMLDFWINEEGVAADDPIFLMELKNFIRVFLDLAKKLASQKIQIARLRKKLFVFFNGDAKRTNISLKELDADARSNLMHQEPEVFSCQHLENASEYSAFQRLRAEHIKDVSMHQTMEITGLLRGKGREEKTGLLVAEIRADREETMRLVSFACHRIFEDISSQPLLKFNALRLVNQAMELEKPAFFLMADRSLVKSLVFVLYLAVTKEYTVPKAEEPDLEEFLRFGIEFIYFWGQRFRSRSKDYPNFVLALDILLEKQVEFPPSLKYFQGDALPPEKQLQAKISREKALLKEFLEGNVDVDTDVSEVLLRLRNIESLLESRDKKEGSQKDLELLRSVKNELDGFKRKKLKYLEFRNNVLKLLLKNRYENESISISAKLPSEIARKLMQGITPNNTCLLPNRQKPSLENEECLTPNKLTSFQRLFNDKQEKIPIKLKSYKPSPLEGEK